MANELNIDFPGVSGLTLTATLIQGNAAVGFPISLTESSTLTGHYSGDMPAVPAGVYNVRFDGDRTGVGIIGWDGTKEVSLLDLPTVAQLEARTLPTADYFDPSVDAVANVTTVATLTNLPSIPTDWITAAGLAADAVAEIQTGLSTLTAPQVRAEADGALAGVGITTTVTGRIDAAVSSRSTYDGADTTGTTTLLGRLTDTRSGYLDTIPDLLLAANYESPLSFLQTEAAVGNALVDYNVAGVDDLTALQTHGDINWSTATGFSTLTASGVWEYEGRALDGTQAMNLASIASIPTNPLLTIDSRLEVLDASISSRATQQTAIVIQDAALALADGRHKIDYLNSTATQYDLDGDVRTVFVLRDQDGNLATSAQTAVERVPNP